MKFRELEIPGTWELTLGCPLQVLRSDRNSKARGGGVFIAVKKHYDMTLLPDLQTNCEILWAKVQISASKSLTLGCFYRPPDSKISTSEELVKSLDLMQKKSYQTIVLGGDFNLPGIDWDNGVVNPKAANKSQCELFLSSCLGPNSQRTY